MIRLLLTTIALALCCISSALGAPAGKKISDYTETLTLTDAWLYELAVPGVTNYKVTFGTMATNIIARVPGGGGGSLVTNANQFGASTTLTLKSGVMVTNLTLPSLTPSRPAFINASGVLTNVSGTPTGSLFVRDDGVLANPAGASLAAPISSVQFNSNGVMQGSAWFTFTNQTAIASNLWDRYNIRRYGAVGDDSTDDSAAFIEAFKQPRVFIPAGRYVVTNLFVTNTCLVEGVAGSVIVFKAGVTNVMVDCSATNVSFRNVEFDGGGTGTPASFGTRHGVLMLSTNGGSFVDCSVHGFSGAGLAFGGEFSPIDLGDTPYVNGGYIYNNGAGFMTSLRDRGGEYTKLLGAQVYSNYIGAWIDAGNVIVANSHFNGNATGIILGNRGNGAHGVIANNTINHNVVALLITNVSTGERITGNTIYYNDVHMYASSNVFISGNSLAAVTFRLATNRFCQIGPNNDFATSVGYFATNDTTTFPDYFLGDGTVPANAPGTFSLQRFANASASLRAGDLFTGLTTANFIDTLAGNFNVVTTNAAGKDVGGVIGLGGQALGLNTLFGGLRGGKENATDDNLKGTLGFYTSGTSTLSERARINSDGYFGIATTNPVSPLHVGVRGTGTYSALLGGRVNIFGSDTNAGQLQIISTDVAAVGKGGVISFAGENSIGNTPYPFAMIRGAKEGSAASWNGYLAFFTTQGDSDYSKEKMRLTSAGWFGLGTTNPSSSLDVTGQVRGASAIFTNSLVVNGVSVTGSGSTQMVAAAIGTLTLTNALSLDVLNVNQINLTNALGSNQVRMGYQDLTNILRRQSIHIGAAAMIPQISEGATFVTDQTSSPTNRMVDSFVFSGTITNSVQFNLTMPENWDLSTVKLKLWTSSTNNIATTTNVWAISAAAIKNTSVITNINWGTEVTIKSVVSSTGGQALLTPATPALTVGNAPTAASLVWFRIRRLPDHADDNDGGQQKLLAAWVQYGETMSEVASW